MQRRAEAMKENFKLTFKEQLLMKVNLVKNRASAFLFFADHVNNFEVANCQGTQEWHRNCKWKAGMSQLRVKWPCGCQDKLLQCDFVDFISDLQRRDAAYW